MIDSFLQDLRFSFRSLRKSPVFTTVAVLTLILGIGSVSAVFSVVDGVLLEPLPYRDADRLALVWTNFGPDLPQNWVSGPEYVEMREMSEAFEELGGVYPSTVSVTGDGDPVQVGAGYVTGHFFRVMGIDASRGRLIGPEDDAMGAPPVVVLGHGFWERRYGGDPEVIGSEIEVNGNRVPVVGVMPEGFRILHPDAQFPDRIDVWLPIVPIMETPHAEMGRGSHYMRVIGRMKPGVSLDRARSDMGSVALRMQEKSPDYYDFPGWDLTVLSLHADLVEDARPVLLVLLGAVAFVLLIACVNVANLQLIRAASREREMAVRTALGAGRFRLLRQLFTESGLLALAGAGGGLLLARWLIDALLVVAPEGLPRRQAIALDGTVVAFTIGAALLTAVLFGLAPAIYAMRQSLVGSLKEGGRGASGGVGGGRARMGLVVAEVALALVLLVGAGLLTRSLNNLLATDPGYDAESVLTMRISLPSSRYDDAARRSFWERLTGRVEALPGVEEAGAISHLPLSGAYSSGTTAVDESDAVEAEGEVAYPAIEADRRRVTVGYFEAMGVPVLRGRAFTEADRQDAAPVAVVDEEFARRFWPSEEALGRRVAIDRDVEGQPVWREIVGVVRHSRHYEVGSVGREQVYFPYSQTPVGSMYLAVRAGTAPERLVGAIRQEVWALDADLPLSDVATMGERVGESVAQPRFSLWLFGAFAATALVLAIIGIYGVVSYTVRQRFREIGVRMALGASRGSVRKLVLRQGMALVGAGLAVGLAAALALSRVLDSMLYEVGAADPATYTGVAVLLAAVAAVACLLPAARATRVDPATVLREE